LLNLLGVGHAYPEAKLSNSELEILSGVEGSNFSVESGTLSRRTTLAWEYLKTTRNSDVSQAVHVASETPTDLAERAATLAVERAGISFDEIGLILGASATPLQTTPSEAQRLGARLDLKIPAYDLYGGGGDIALQLATLRSWKPTKVPKYVLCFSSNTPSQRVDYSKGIEGYLFGDGAAAVVVSVTQSGRFEVVSSNITVYPQYSSLMKIHLYAHVDIKYSELASWADQAMTGEVTALLGQEDLSADRSCWIAPQLGSMLSGMRAAIKGSGGVILDSLESPGYCMGGSEFAVLSEHWDKELSEEVALMIFGAGICCGRVYLRQVRQA